MRSLQDGLAGTGTDPFRGRQRHHLEAAAGALEAIHFSHIILATNRETDKPQRYQALLDQSTPFVTYRWVGTGVGLLMFFLRILVAQGWYIGTYWR